MVQQNSLVRKVMLSERAIEQAARLPASRLEGFPAFINRRTGKPHGHHRERARRTAAALYRAGRYLDQMDVANSA